MRLMTLQAIRAKSIKHSDIATATGMGKPWVTKFLSGKTRFIQEDVMFKIQDLLGINYFKVEKAAGERSPIASRIASMVDTDPAFAKIAVALEDALTEARASFTPRYVETKDMSKLGQEIIRIAFANEDKPGKVAREVLKLLA